MVIQRFLTVLLLLLQSSHVYADTNAEGLAFLKENREKEGIFELPSGLQYKVLKKGSGVYHPKAETPCSCHYTGSLIDGTVFDSSVERGEPTTFAPNQVIKGWTETMSLMVQGDKWEMYIPSDLAYGDSGSPPKIPGGSALIFQMEIMEIMGDGVLALKCEVSTGGNCSEKENKFIVKMKSWESDKVPKELARLEKLMAESEKSMKADLAAWIKNRIYLIKQVAGARNEEL
mmetsp:Transcript_19753/g.25432  ORF Transcript_19753/g.25432 Transcript_19753/m.25432 type:complete len:231 (+) Transcript_19753:99-791(+)|eukprot:CAMPEP_0198139650 /NCGR_PEP_ID=MMETSP1443-20131203/2923_1 /TAXON_ID=186043 /ORGANISM="Entomoneis sp., Strain CCMP2396" /LENGTH=230 /DNA_ID=CAMNT_0043801841 /DNA_START=81 /DNA_END=773 /DNA_ORIENTATION=-